MIIKWIKYLWLTKVKGCNPRIAKIYCNLDESDAIDSDAIDIINLR